MTEAQKAKALKMVGKFTRHEIAKKLGVSFANLKRSMPGVTFYFQHGKYKHNPELVKKILDYYQTHTRAETVKKFNKNGVKARSIVDYPQHYGFKPNLKQIRWTTKQIIEAVKMHGLVSRAAQAKYFNRPGAGPRSIHEMFCRQFDLTLGLNGLAGWNAKYIALDKSKFITPMGNSRDEKPVKHLNLYLWVDLENNLNPGVADSIKEGIKSMADFQRWLWNSKNPKPLIMKMIEEREIKKVKK
jgi:hypothetical protein